MMRRGLTALVLLWGVIIAGLPIVPTQAQTPTPQADVAAYLLGVTAETKPGSELVYSIAVTNNGPATVDSFYIVDGWTVNNEGLSAFALPIGDPDFGSFTLGGTWEQRRSDQKVFAWLLNGNLAAGDTVEFKWKVRVADQYKGGLVNWARIITIGTPDGTWQPRRTTDNLTLPLISAAADPDTQNNRTLDGVTVVSETPSGQGVDLAIYQAGFLTQLKAAQPIDSTWLVTNLGPQSATQFYLESGWPLGQEKNSLLVQPVQEPNFGDFKVLGRWRQVDQDEERWLWLLQGNFSAGSSQWFTWSRFVSPDYHGDLVNWSRVFTHELPDGQWTPREGTSTLPTVLQTPTDTNPDNDRSSDAVSTIIQ